VSRERDRRDLPAIRDDAWGELPTRRAHWGHEEHRYGAWDVFGDLSRTESLAGLSAIAASGLRLTAEQQGIVDDAAIAVTLADPRLWPLKAARMIASYGRPTFAATVGSLVPDDSPVGPASVGRAGIVLAELALQLRPLHPGQPKRREAIAQFVESRRILPGFGVPFRQIDERRVFFERRVTDKGRDGLWHWQCWRELVVEVRQQRGLEPNIAMPIAAALLDAGMPPTSMGPLTQLIMFHMYVSNALEGAEPEQRLLQRAPDRCVRYVGRPMRTSVNKTPR